MILYRYFSETLPGNLHQVVGWVNEHRPHWNIIAMEFDGGGYSTVVHRVLSEEWLRLSETEQKEYR